MKVVLSGALLRFSRYTREVDVEAQTLAECLDSLTSRFPQLQPVLLDGDGRVRATHQLFINGEQLERGRYAVGAPALPVADRDTLFVLTAVAGG